MAAHNRFARVSPDGFRPQDRTKKAGYTGGLSSDQGHGEALMNPAFKEVGFGQPPSTGGDHSADWVQDLDTHSRSGQ
ncbi:hypothetical protein DEFR109230_00470 [Deinococcus frigens]